MSLGMASFNHSTTSVSNLSPPAVDDRLFSNDLECVLQNTRQNESDASVPRPLHKRKDTVDVEGDFEEDHEDGSGEGSNEDYEEGSEDDHEGGAAEDFEEDSENSESDSSDVSVTTWIPPKIHAGNLEYTIWKLMPFEEHEIYDELIVHLFEACKGPWPSYEEVLNDVKLASSILLLVVATACPNIPLKPQWRVSENVAVLAEQDNLRKKLAFAVLGKSFQKLRSLGFWYDGY
ncbi:hypothetical protein CERSUDRAFT_119409 [Gelatoporia subvermispora B]|uniref:PiggyBac transposable element-derived protein domain-containing protein n=1 Tax=Ceriporiopsis subvermispora (strain B) TaxID=914234 RepID=M2QZ69_CERS8|nr:hypothetical protein CERSUDRAFT_119409 [Gelatoporia subvermispora B]